MEEDGALRHVHAGKEVGIDRAAVPDPDDDALDVHARAERQGRQVEPVRVAVERRVEIGPGIADHRDRPDVELRPGRVAGA